MHRFPLHRDVARGHVNEPGFHRDRDPEQVDEVRFDRGDDGGGTGTDTNKGTERLAFRADMGFSQGKFVATDGPEARLPLFDSTYTPLQLDRFSPFRRKFMITTCTLTATTCSG